MIALLLSLTAATGTYLLYSACIPAPAPAVATANPIGAIRHSFFLRLASIGVPAERFRSTAVAIVLSALAAAALAWLAFGGVAPPLLLGLFGATLPPTLLRRRVATATREAADAWPAMIEEVRLNCGSLGRPVPQALLDAGKRGPETMRPAFLAAEREWLLTTDFDRTLAVLRRQLRDHTADIVCETLLVAHSVGGTDVERRLASLASDRRSDLNLRKEARAKQAGVRFARRFVLVVPLGMAVVGMSIGNGREAYSSASGQVGVAFALLTLGACWLWAGRLIALPQPGRVTRD